MRTISLEEFKKLYGNPVNSIQSFSNNQQQDGFFGGMNETLSGIKGSLPSVANRAKNIGSAISKSASTGSLRDLLSAGLSVPGQTIGAAYDVVGSALSPVVDASDKARNLLSPNGDLGQGLRDRLEPLVSDWLKLKNDNPQLAQDIENVVLIGGAFLGARGKQPSTSGTITKITEASSPGMRSKGVIGNVASDAGRTLKAIGERSYGITITPEMSTKVALRNYYAKYPDVYSRIKAEITGEELAGKPITEANTAARFGIMGTEMETGVQSTRFAKNLWTEKIQPALNASDYKVNMKTFFSEIEKEIRKIPELSKRNARLEALNSMKEQYKAVNSISLEKLQEYKEGWAETLPEASYAGKPIATALKDVKSTMATKARGIIYKYAADDNVRMAYEDYGNLKSIIKSADKILSDPAKKSLGRNIWQFIMDKTITPIATIGGRVLYKTGEGLEIWGNKGAKTIGDVVK